MPWSARALTALVVAFLMLLCSQAFASPQLPSPICSDPGADAEPAAEPAEFYLECDDGLLFPEIAEAPVMCGSDGSNRIGEAPAIDPETGEWVAAPRRGSEYACAPAPDAPRREPPEPPEKATVESINSPAACIRTPREVRRPPLARNGPLGQHAQVYRPPRG